MPKALGVDWAPAQVPLNRRLQTAAVFVVLYFLLSPLPYLMIYFYFLIFTKYWWLMIGYILWMIYDEDAPKRGSRTMFWFRNLHTFKKLAEYFPAKLEKTSDLDPSKNYIFACHPHGIAGIGFFASFATNGTKFSEIFPKFHAYTGTLSMNFWIPFRRELLMFLGVVDVSKESIVHNISRGHGNVQVIVIGGAREALEAKPGHVNLVLKDRKGFVKLALKQGVDLVPVFSFGENEIFEQVEAESGTFLKEFQLKTREHLPFTMPMFYGRGIFNYTLGFMPFRKAIITIVGDPVAVEKIASPSNEDVDETHKRYLAALDELYEKHKTRFGIADDVHLHFI